MSFGTKDRPYQQIATVGGRVEKADPSLTLLQTSDHATVVAPKWQETAALASILLVGGREVFFGNGPHVLFPVTPFPMDQPEDVHLSWVGNRKNHGDDFVQYVESHVRRK